MTAKKAGRHSFRFENRVNPGMPPVKVSFRILGDEKAMAASDGGNLEKLDPVLTELRHLNNLLRSSRDEHAFFMDREVEHRNRKFFFPIY